MMTDKHLELLIVRVNQWIRQYNVCKLDDQKLDWIHGAATVLCYLDIIDYEQFNNLTPTNNSDDLKEIDLKQIK